MSLTRERNDTTNEIRLEGCVRIESASELKTLLMEELSATRQLRVDLGGTSELDVCILQLLLCAKREWAQIGLGFTLAGPISNEVCVCIANAGFDALDVTSDRSILSEA